METRARRTSLIGPIILIGAGILFLLNNLGLLSWDVWPALLRLWPALLIGIGLDLIIGHRSFVGSVAIVIVLLVAFIIAISPFVGRSVAEQEATIEEISQPLEGAQRADVEIRVGAGELSVSSLPVEEDRGAARLIEGQVSLPPQGRLQQESRRVGDTLVYVLRSEGSRNWAPWRSGTSLWEDDKWELQLNREVPMKLQLSTGIGRAMVDLSRMNITSLRVDAGVGEATVTLPRQGDLDANIKTGVGSVTLVVPQGMAARITVHRGLGDVNVKGDYVQDGDIYTSPGYDMAVNRVEMDVQCGIGELIVR